MHFVILGAGAVGAYYGAKLARAKHQVTFLTRGSHLKAIRERGLLIWSPLGDFTVPIPVEENPEMISNVDVVVLAVKTYDNRTALPLLKPLMSSSTVVLTLQNGVDCVDEVAEVVGRHAVIAGSTYIATARLLPGLIEQTGTHQLTELGEVFDIHLGISDRVKIIGRAIADSGIEVNTVPDGQLTLWEKFIYLSPFAGFTGAARAPIGPLWSDQSTRELFLRATIEVENVARAEGINVSPSIRERIIQYSDALPHSTRSSLLIDLSKGKPIEVEALQGSVVRRGRLTGVATPIMETLYAILKPHASGTH